MNRYGCWDCGSEVPPFQGRCVVCGWPAPPPRRRRRWPVALFLVIAVSTVAFAAFFVGFEGHPRILRKFEAAHRWVQPRGSLCGHSIKCLNCGAGRFSEWGSRPCPNVGLESGFRR